MQQEKGIKWDYLGVGKIDLKESGTREKDKGRDRNEER